MDEITAGKWSTSGFQLTVLIIVVFLQFNNHFYEESIADK
jgi:hypothetical protein